MKRYKTNIKNKYIIYLLPFLLVFFFLISGIVLTWSGTALAWCEQGAGGWCHSDSGCSAGYYYCSYDWVMHQNVLDMVFFVSGGKTMRKPYISSSNYILKMSNYKKGEWSNEWDDMYWKFLRKNKKKLWKFRYNFPSLKNL